ISIDPKGGRIVEYPSGCRIAVIQRNGKLVFGGLLVVDGDNDTSCAIGERAAKRVANSNVRDDPAAAVKVDESRQRPCTSANWPVDPYRQIRRRTGNKALVDAVILLGLPSEIFERQHRDASLGGCHRLERPGPGI